jgi:2-polyprenyl-3-methyl-5-hydroxy-6-metoxy-1,4-benzoquinol methylase
MEGEAMPEEFGEAFWEERYRGHAAHHSRGPNPQLVAEAADLARGTALDAGCGEGADAIWLASRGWRVTAVDIAATALHRAREHAETEGSEVTGRIEWVQADLTRWAPAEEHFDLVCAHYVHPAAPGEALFGRLAAAVAPGGTLLIVGHHPSGQQTPGVHSSSPAAYLTAEEVAAGLDRHRWDIAVAEARSRPAGDHDGHETMIRDAVLRARKRP